jgi:hypothetical protein
MGRIIDPVKANDRNRPCHGFVIPPSTVESVIAEYNRTGQIPAKDVFLFKEGILGALSDDQDITLCAPNKTHIEPASPKLQHRWKVIKGLEGGVCLGEVEKVAMIIYLNRAAEQTLDEEERSLLDNSIKMIQSIPSCEGNQ